jgi:hypothetical protein
MALQLTAVLFPHLTLLLASLALVKHLPVLFHPPPVPN